MLTGGLSRRLTFFTGAFQRCSDLGGDPSRAIQVPNKGVAIPDWWQSWPTHHAHTGGDPRYAIARSCLPPSSSRQSVRLRGSVPDGDLHYLRAPSNGVALFVAPIHEQDVRISRDRQSQQRCRIGLSSRMSSSLFGSPRRPKAPQLHTLRLFADRLDLFGVSSLCQQVIDPACIAAVPSSSLLWPIMLVSSIVHSSSLEHCSRSRIVDSSDIFQRSSNEASPGSSRLRIRTLMQA